MMNSDHRGCPPEHAERLSTCEEILDYRFQDLPLLLTALTHASGAQHRLASNERLEFLGDTVLGMLVCSMLYEQFPDYLEGELTKIKSVVVSRQTCAKISQQLDLSPLLIVGKGISAGKPVPHSLLADVFESLVAAIYLDGGMEEAGRFVDRCMRPEIELAASGTQDENFKSILQQTVQRDHGATPTYLLCDETGPDHDKSFKVAAVVNGQEYPPAWGRNKKEAEQRAASNAIAILSGDSLPYPEPETESESPAAEESITQPPASDQAPSDSTPESLSEESTPMKTSDRDSRTTSEPG